MAETITTPFGPLRTSTRRRFVLVKARGDNGKPYAAGYTDNFDSAVKRARRMKAAVVDRVKGAIRVDDRVQKGAL